MARAMRDYQAQFVAIDGEAVDDHYVLLCASDGHYAYNPQGLSTIDCLTFVRGCKERNPGKTLVMFGSGYDVNMWLRDVPQHTRERLWADGKCRMRFGQESWSMMWIPAKLFVASPGPGLGYKVQDVWGIFGCSFVRALENWGIDAPDVIARMKQERSSFQLSDIDEIRHYCFQECALLVELMSRVAQAATKAGWRPRAWHGAGALAATMLRHHQADRHIVHDDAWKPAVLRAVMGAYYGGRVETYGIGHYAECRSYDIRSAYPAALTTLPSLTGGGWRQARAWRPDAPDWSVWHVEWDVPRWRRVMPFPLRDSRQVWYVTRGSGWYWQPEVRAAMEAMPECVRVTHGHVFTPATDEQPWAFVAGEYERRAQLKRDGHAAQLVIKLAINSLYGKLAQGLAYNNQTPPFQSFMLAGLVTSRTRAAIARVALPNWRRVVSIATDGIVLEGTQPVHGLDVSDQLGAWESDTYRNAFVLQPGVYIGTASDGQAFGKTRGWFPREIDWDDVQRLFARDGEYGAYSCPSDRLRFIGAGSCVQLGDWSQWRTWQPANRNLSFYPARKWPGRRILKHGQVKRVLLECGDDERAVAQRYVPRGHDPGAYLTDADPDYIAGREQPLRAYDV